MSGRIIDISERSHHNGKATNGASTELILSRSGARRKASCAPIPIHEWDVDVVAMLTIERGVVPATAHVRLAIDLDPLTRRYSVAVAREGWPSFILRSGYRPDETLEQAARREGVIVFLNELLSASYGVPA